MGILNSVGIEGIVGLESLDSGFPLDFQCSFFQGCNITDFWKGGRKGTYCFVLFGRYFLELRNGCSGSNF